MRSRTARVMTTLMRNGRDRRSENPFGPTRYLSACSWLGPISGSHQGQQPLRLHRDRGNPPSENRPYTWLHPNTSQKVKLLLHRGRRPYMAQSGVRCGATECPLSGGGFNRSTQHSSLLIWRVETVCIWRGMHRHGPRGSRRPSSRSAGRAANGWRAPPERSRNESGI